MVNNQNSLAKIKKLRLIAFLIAIIPSIIIGLITLALALAIHAADWEEDSDPIKPTVMAFIIFLGLFLSLPNIILSIATWFWTWMAIVLGSLYIFLCIVEFLLLPSL